MKLVIAVLVGWSTVADAGPLAIEAKPATSIWHVGEPVDVMVRVTNTSAAPQQVRAMSCSWYTHWTSTDATLRSEGWPCHANAPLSVTIEPGKSYEKVLPMTATVVGARRLELSFTPYGAGATTAGTPVAIAVVP